MLKGNRQVYLKTKDSRHGDGDYHYGTSAAITAALSAAMKFWDEWGKNQSPTARMVINDQSLVWGGMFDLAGDWNNLGEHKNHREGINVDITYYYWNQAADSGTESGVLMPQALRSDVYLWLKDRFTNVQDEPAKYHWHCIK